MIVASLLSGAEAALPFTGFVARYIVQRFTHCTDRTRWRTEMSKRTKAALPARWR